MVNPSMTLEFYLHGPTNNTRVSILRNAVTLNKIIYDKDFNVINILPPAI